MAVKVLIVYYSMTGAGTQMARWAAKEAEKQGAEVRLRKVKELVPQEVIDKNPPAKQNSDASADILEAVNDDLLWADALIFSSPSRFGAMASQLKQFFDTKGGLWAQGLLANKFVTAFSSAQNEHGGQENVVLNIYTVMQHWGCFIVPSGYGDPAIFEAGGNPYGTSATVDGNGQILNPDKIKKAINVQVDRLVETASAYLNGKNN